MDTIWVLKEGKQITLHSLGSADNIHWLRLKLKSLLLRYILDALHLLLQSWRTSSGRTPIPFDRSLQRYKFILCGDFVSADLLNAFHWERALDIQCCECVQATNYLIKMGNKQTIFTDEQLDAYQVSLCPYLCLESGCQAIHSSE